MTFVGGTEGSQVYLVILNHMPFLKSFKTIHILQYTVYLKEHNTTLLMILSNKYNKKFVFISFFGRNMFF